MRPVRSALIALGAACALVPSFAGVAQAQERYIVNSAAECNTTTGEYDVTVTFANNGSELDFVNVVASYEATGRTDQFDLPDFNIPGEGDLDVRYSVPGDASSAELSWDIPQLQESNRDSIKLAGDCAAIATTTTTATPSTTTAAPTTTTVAGTAAVVATPHYTG